MAEEGKLCVLEGFMHKKSYTLRRDREIQIGRNRRCEIPIMSRRVSRAHAAISCRNGVYAISDLSSKTGTLVNDQKIRSTVLRHNDLIQIGDVKFRFLLEEEKAAATVSEPLVIAPNPVSPPVQEKPETREPPSETEVSAFSEEELGVVGETISDIKLIAPISQGRRTVIYKGIQSARNRVVAMKMLKPEAAKDPAVIGWFINGTTQAGKLMHEDAVAPLGGGREGSVFYAYTPFMENGNAQKRFAKALEEGLPAVKRALESLVHVARALEFAKAKQFLHLGLRPSKILYNENRRAKLSGLGYDNSLTAPGAESSREIEAYIAPEQVGYSTEVTFAADIFSLGATFYYMLTGQRPKRDHRWRMTSPKLVNREIPDSICRIIEKMVAPVPEERYLTYDHILHDLRWALRGEVWPHT